MKKSVSIRKISVIGVLCALSYLCMFLLKFKVGFLSFDLKDAFLCIISFLYGPIYGSASALLVAFIEFISVSETGIYGFLMDAISGIAFAGTCGFIYKFKRTLNGAVVGLLTAVAFMTAVMLCFNLIITPKYMGVEVSQVASMIPTLFLPFNLIKGLVNMGLTLILYKPLTTAFKKTGLIVSSIAETDKRKSWYLAIFSAILIVISIIIILLVFKGGFEFFTK